MINVTVEVRSIPMFYACIRSVGVTLLLMSSEYGFSFCLMSDATSFVFVCETVSVVLTAIARSLFFEGEGSTIARVFSVVLMVYV